MANNVEKLLTYEGLIDHLRKGNYKEIEEGKFVVRENKKLGIEELLVVKKGSNYKEDLKNLKDELRKSEEVVEGERVEYGILFVDNYVLFLKKENVGLSTKVIVLKKSLDKISPAFKKKLEKLAKDFGEIKYWNELFDRSDIVEEFYKLYVKAKELLIKNIKGIDDDKKKIKFANNLLMQLFIIWYLQEKGFLDGDKRYLINKFKEYKSLGFNSYYEFLKELFNIMMGDKGGNLTFKDDKFGKIVITGPAPFINGDIIENVEIPDKVFYGGEEKTEELKKIEPKNVKDVPILNLFESRDWVVEGGDVEGDITDMMLGDIFEKQMVEEERKDSGSYYTPAKITRYISQNAIESYVLDKLNKELKTNYKTLDEFFENEKDLESYKLLYEILNDIKILDPACGSGHFLERAVEVLVGIYERLRDKVKELGFDSNLFVIKVADDNGNIRNENLLSIDDEEFKMRLKFHVIVSKNIYGVDINESAVEISKARLFLSIAKHFDKNKGIFVRFPNVHFNIRTGNSLIGYARMKKPEKTLDAWIKLDSEKIEELKEEFKVISELGDYLKEVSKVLNQKGDILKDIEELNRIISKRELNWLDFEKVLKIKEKLVEILLVSLNSKYAIPLNKLLRDINKKFNEKLDKMFIKEFEVDEYVNPKTLKENVKRFHWFFEFSEVFTNKDGFDIIIGNPPYGNISNEVERKIIRESYPFKVIKFNNDKKGTNNIAAIFIERSYMVLRNCGTFGMIVPHRITRAEEFEKTRNFLLNCVNLYHIVDSGNPFKKSGVNLEMVEIFYKKSKTQTSCSTYSRRYDFNGYVNKEICKKFGILMIYFNKDLEEIFLKMMKNSKLGIIDATQGKPRRKDYVDNGEIICIGARDIDPYRIRIVSNRRVNLEYVKNNNLEEQLNNELLLCPNFSNKFEVAIKKKGFLPDGTSVIIKPKIDIDKYYLMAILNSDIINFFLWNFILNRGELTNNICSYVTNRVPIKLKNINKIIKMSKEVEKGVIDKSEIDEEIRKIYGIEDLYNNIQKYNKK